jgi:hypothetical protein
MKMQPRILPLSLRKLRVSVRMTTILVGVGYFHSRSFDLRRSREGATGLLRMTGSLVQG